MEGFARPRGEGARAPLLSIHHVSQDKYTKIVQRLAKGCMGLRYSYFNQGTMDAEGMKRDLLILGDFQGKDQNPFSGGICFGLAVMYLAGSSPKGRSTWASSDALMAEFDKAIKLAPESQGMLQSVAQAYVRQKQAGIMRRGDVANPQVLACRGCGRQYPTNLTLTECMRCGSKNLETKSLRQEDVAALAKLHGMTPERLNEQRYEKSHATTQGAYTKTLERFRANARDNGRVGLELDGHSTPYKHAIRDQLMANFSFKPSPAHDAAGVRRNHQTFPLELAADADEFLDYKPHFKERGVKALVDFCGAKGSFSLISYERMMVGGHAMALWSDGSRTRFFDPNFGVISFSFQSGMVTFLSRYLPFLYCWKGARDGSSGDYKRSSETFMSSARIANIHWSYSTLDIDVYRYAM